MIIKPYYRVFTQQRFFLGLLHSKHKQASWNCVITPFLSASSLHYCKSALRKELFRTIKLVFLCCKSCLTTIITVCKHELQTWTAIKRRFTQGLQWKRQWRPGASLTERRCSEGIRWKTKSRRYRQQVWQQAKASQVLCLLFDCWRA